MPRVRFVVETHSLSRSHHGCAFVRVQHGSQQQAVCYTCTHVTLVLICTHVTLVSCCTHATVSRTLYLRCSNVTCIIDVTTDVTCVVVQVRDCCC